jgi:hypothetical protein
MKVLAIMAQRNTAAASPSDSMMAVRSSLRFEGGMNWSLSKEVPALGSGAAGRLPRRTTEQVNKKLRETGAFFSR